MSGSNHGANQFYILTPVYRAERYLEGCIQSVLDQSYQDFQLVLVDDGSPDGSGKICDRFAASDSRIHALHQENQGQISAREAARRFAEAQDRFEDSYIVYLDSDDSLKRDALEILDRVILSRQCDMVIYGMDRVSNGKTVRKFDSKKSYTGVVTDKRVLYKIVFGNWAYNSLCRKAVSAKLLAGADYSRYQQVRHGEDLLQSIPCYERCRKAVFIKEALYNYTVNPASVTHSVRYENCQINPTVRKAVWDFLKAQKVWSEQDFEEYLSYLRRLLKEKVRTIAGLDTEMQNKVRLFDEIRADDYYGMVLNSRGPEERLLNLLASGNDSMLVNIVGLRNWLANEFGRFFRLVKSE